MNFHTDKIFKQSYFKQCDLVDVHADVFGTKVNVKNVGHNLKLLESGTYYVDKIYNRAYG